MVFIFQFVSVVYHIDWFADFKESLHSWDKAHLVMVYDLFNMVPFKINFAYSIRWAFLGAQSVKNLPAVWKTQVRFLGQKYLWRSEWLPTPVFLPREFHGQRSLSGYSPRGSKESNTTAWLTPSLSDFIVRGKVSCWLLLVHMYIHVPSLYNEVVVLLSLNYQGTFPKMLNLQSLNCFPCIYITNF